jgi:hypothetical protein
MVALAHKMNRGFIADLVAASGPAIEIPQIVNGDDAASALLAAVETAIVDIKYRNRMPFSISLEVVMPMWFLAQIRAAISRRRGVLAMQVSTRDLTGSERGGAAVPRLADASPDPGGPARPPDRGAADLGPVLAHPFGTWLWRSRTWSAPTDSTAQPDQLPRPSAEDGGHRCRCARQPPHEVALDPSGRGAAARPSA